MTSNAWRDKTIPNAAGSTTNDVRGDSTAFRGASRAFSSAHTPGKSLQIGHHSQNAALTAASAAGLGKQKGERIPRGPYSGTPQTREESVKRFGTSNASDTQGTARRNVQSGQQSPSQAAALFATTLKALTTQDTDADPGNESAVSDINSLVNLFESKERRPRHIPIVHSVRYVTKGTPLVAHTRPITPATRSSKAFRAGFSTAESTKSAGPPRDTITETEPLPSSLRNVSKLSAPHYFEDPTFLDGTDHLDEPSIADSLQFQNTVGPSSDETERFLNEAASNLKPKPRPANSPVRPALSTRRTEPVPLARSSAALQRPSLSPRQGSKELPDSVRPNRKPGRASDSYVPQLSVDALANAMVASSLASSRAPSPSKPPPLPPPRRHGKHSLLPNHGHQDASRTPSPAKRMRQTMREPMKSDDEEGARKHRSHMVRKHPNKYNEGDRKRYRNQVTERERKRYEGVWAANRGILLDADSSDAVINIVVRDIWKRSRLPDDVLEEVWNLVDSRGLAKLDKAEFVVGMFLIDQRLKGNKLPFKVSDSIWSSVRHLSGINVSRDKR